jgi:hypothetical protein
MCGGIEFSWDDLASVAYRMTAYYIVPLIAGMSARKWPVPS